MPRNAPQTPLAAAGRLPFESLTAGAASSRASAIPAAFFPFCRRGMPRPFFVRGAGPMSGAVVPCQFWRHPWLPRRLRKFAVAPSSFLQPCFPPTAVRSRAPETIAAQQWDVVLPEPCGMAADGRTLKKFFYLLLPVRHIIEPVGSAWGLLAAEGA